MTMTLRFDAVSEANPGPKWEARWQRSWPAYRSWFLARGGHRGPDRKECREAMERYMPELLPVYDRLTLLAGNSDLAARFLSTWCPPTYLGGCSLAAAADGDHVRLVRNYDLSPDLNEGLLLRTAWTGRAVMGMVEFLWGLSDGINDAGLSVALAYGGRSETGRGFGITTILRYVLETCDTVPEALQVFRRVPSHMAYNIVVADRDGRTASVELSPGGGVSVMPHAIATNHQSGPTVSERPAFMRSFERYSHLETMERKPLALRDAFMREPLKQDRYSEGFGTLFTAEYDCVERCMELTWPDDGWVKSLDGFTEGTKVVSYESAPEQSAEYAQGDMDWSKAAFVDWFAVARDFMNGQGRPIESYLAGNAVTSPPDFSKISTERQC
ncbi:C45 family autoproteolytic acyltransferase/hydolase [Amaricoccus tamworthensis]|uniref:C45 family autoproteolytic acyltransferase/hydolase n=1 Tax=Amaricoccus tamworthensis TaxID=57002 RepID=UPI003C7BE157